MPISSTTRKAGPFYGNDSTVAFPFAYKVFAETDVAVLRACALGVETRQALGDDYTIALNADQDETPGGVVTLNAPLSTGCVLVLLSDIPDTQPQRFVNQGGFLPEALNDGLDRPVALLQQLREQIDRTISLPATSQVASLALPTPMPGQVVAWDSTGTALTLVDPATLISVVAYGNTKADKFDGDGSAVSFELTASPGSVNNLAISIDGVVQVPGVDYTWGGGNALTFTVAPPDGTKILVRYQEALAESVDISGKADKTLGNLSASDVIAANLKLGIPAALADKAETSDLNSVANLLANHIGAGGAVHAAAVAGGANGFMTGADKTKLDSVASGATVNASNAALRDRATHTGTQLAATIADFAENVDDRVAALLTAGSNITLTYDDSANTLTIESTASGGGGGGSVDTVNGKPGPNPVLNAADVGAAGTNGSGINAASFRTALGGGTIGQSIFMAALPADARALLGLGDAATKTVGVTGGVASYDDVRFGGGGGGSWGEITPEAYGATADGSLTANIGINNGIYLQAAVNDAVAQNKTLVLSGFYRTATTVTAALNAYPNRLRVRGTGVGQCGIIFDANAQLLVTGNHSLSSEWNGLLFQAGDFSVRTATQSTTSPIRLNLTGGTGNTIVSGLFDNLDIRGMNGVCGFKYAIECFNARYVKFSNVAILGDRTVIDINPGSKAVVSLGGIYCGGDSDPVDATFENVEVAYVQNAFVVAGAFEGVIWDGVTVVNANIGIEDRRGAGVADPLFQVVNSHFNTWTYGVVCENRFQSIIQGNLFYNFGGYPGWTGLKFINSIGQASDTSLLANKFFVFSSGCTGIDISGSAGDDTFDIGHSSFNGIVPMAVGINLGTGANRVTIADTNTFAGCTTPITPDSALASNKVHQALYNIGGGVVTMLGAGQSEHKLPVSEFAVPASFYPTTDNARILGRADRRWSDLFSVNIGSAGTASLTNVGVSGTATFNGTVGFNGGFNVSSGAGFGSNVNIGGALTVAGNAQMNGGFNVASGQSIGQDGGVVYCRDSIFPTADNADYLGGGSNRWIAVFATVGTIQTSDPRLKDMTPLGYAEAERLIFAISPVAYRYKDGREKEHMGFNAEEVRDAFHAEGRTDFGGVTERTDDTPMGLNYAELVPVLWAQVQALTERLKALEAR